MALRDRVLEVIQSANQRGGRMLSVIDLLNAGTLTLAQLAWLLYRIEKGSGWLVGARPGGAGKTTIMCALLAMLPRETRIRVAAADEDWRACQPGDCLVAYEIGRGWYRGYVWDEALRGLCALGERGCRIVANLHADTLAEAKEQIQRDNGVSDRGMAAFGMFLPLTVRGGWDRGPERVVERIAYLDETTWRKRTDAPDGRQEEISQVLLALQHEGIIDQESVRERWLAWQDANPPR